MDAFRSVGHHCAVPARRFLTVFACVSLLAPVAARAAAPDLNGRLARALEVSGVSSATSGAIAVNLQTGEPLFAHNADLPLEPASNEKLAVTYTALRELGPSYRFRTEVLGAGHRAGHDWDGSLYLKGDGDPTLTSADLLHLVHVLRGRGIRRVTGFVIGDASWFDSRVGVTGWKPSFIGLESPFLSALEVDDGWNGHAQERNPPLAGAGRFDQLLRENGIEAREARVGTAPPNAVLLGNRRLCAACERDRVDGPLQRQLHRRDAAEGDRRRGDRCRQLRGGRADRDPRSRRGRRADDRRPDRRRLRTLARRPRHRARARRPARRALARAGDARRRLGGLPLAGSSGTLEYRMQSGAAHGNVRAKTGTTDIASALSGYVRRNLAFAVLENGYPVDWTAAHEAQDRFVQALASARPRPRAPSGRPRRAACTPAAAVAFLAFEPRPAPRP